MTQAELDDLAREAQDDLGAMGYFTYLLGYLYLAGMLRLVEVAPDFCGAARTPLKSGRPTRTHSDNRTDALAPR